MVSGTRTTSLRSRPRWPYHERKLVAGWIVPSQSLPTGHGRRLPILQSFRPAACSLASFPSIICHIAITTNIFHYAKLLVPLTLLSGLSGFRLKLWLDFSLIYILYISWLQMAKQRLAAKPYKIFGRCSLVCSKSSGVPSSTTTILIKLTRSPTPHGTKSISCVTITMVILT